MRTIGTFIIALFFAGQAFAQTIDFDFTSHDFGEVQAGDSVSIEFPFTNNGTEDLILMDVQVTCGCTTPYWPTDPIAPGESAVIKAQFNTKGKSGKFDKPLTITSNATNLPLMRIYLKGIIVGGEEE